MSDQPVLSPEQQAEADRVAAEAAQKAQEEAEALGRELAASLDSAQQRRTAVPNITKTTTERDQYTLMAAAMRLERAAGRTPEIKADHMATDPNLLWEVGQKRPVTRLVSCYNTLKVVYTGWDHEIDPKTDFTDADRIAGETLRKTIQAFHNARAAAKPRG